MCMSVPGARTPVRTCVRSTRTHVCTHVYMHTHLFVHACAHAQPAFLPSVRRPRLHGLLPVMLCEEPGCGRTGQGGYEAWK